MARNPRGSESQSACIERVLKNDIEAGVCPVGSALPSERKLAARFGASRWPVQHAVDALARQGYLEARHGSGVYVRDRSQDICMANHVPLYMDSRGHIMTDLAKLLHDRLHDLDLFVTTLDMSHGRSRWGTGDLCVSAMHRAGLWRFGDAAPVVPYPRSGTRMATRSAYPERPSAPCVA